MAKTKLKDYHLPEYLLERKVSIKDSIMPFGEKKDTYDLASPVLDDVFKMMFQSEENKKFPCYLISKFLDVDYEYLLENLVLYKNVFSREKLKDKKRIGDFVGKLGNTFISIEMNNTNKLARNVGYAGSLYSDTGKKLVVNGKETKEYIYGEVFQVNLNNFTFADMDKDITINITRDESYMRTSIILIDVYIPNIIRKCREKGIDSLTEQERVGLAMFISKKKEAIMLSKGDEILMKYIDKLEKLKGTEEVEDDINEFYEYDLVQLGKLYGLEEGHEKGRAEGKEEGRVETQKEMVQTMIKDGLDNKTIQKYTKMPLYEIESLRYISNDLKVAEPEGSFENENPVE